MPIYCSFLNIGDLLIPHLRVCLTNSLIYFVLSHTQWVLRPYSWLCVQGSLLVGFQGPLGVLVPALQSPYLRYYLCSPLALF